MPLPSYFEHWIAKLRAVIDGGGDAGRDPRVDDVRDWLGKIQNGAGPAPGLAAAQAAIENLRLTIEGMLIARTEPDAEACDEDAGRDVERWRALAREELNGLVELLADIPPSERAEPR